jgi:hypothetical protein
LRIEVVSDKGVPMKKLLAVLCFVPVVFCLYVIIHASIIDPKGSLIMFGVKDVEGEMREIKYKTMLQLMGLEEVEG